MSESGYMPLRIQEVAAPDVLTDALRFRRSLEIDTVGIMLFAPTGEILYANEALLRMGGWSREDVRNGLRWTDLTPPEWQGATMAALEQLVNTGSGIPYEKQYFRKDGSRLWVMIASKLLSDNEGIAFVTDVTERKEAEARLQITQEQLQKSDSQLQTLVDSLPALIAYFDTNLCYLRVNRAYASFYGTTPDAVVGRRVDAVVGPVYAEIANHLQRALQGEPQSFEVIAETHRGKRHLLAQHVPDLDASGRVRGVIVQSQDITERRNTERMLRTAEKLAAVGRLAASMAHEINNPLEAVTNLLYLARGSDERPVREGYLEQAEAELRRVSSITNQTLRFHKQSTRPLAICAEDIFDSVLTIYARRIQNGGVEVEQRVRTARPVLCFDGEIRQVLSNLVSNALDAMSGRRSVLKLRACVGVDWKTSRQGVRITVADSGTGMGKTVLAHVWEPFFTTKEIGGTGLGLWISRDIAERHAGKLHVRSREGVGTAFTLWLPFEAVVR